jgi:hypothetical protein
MPWEKRYGTPAATWTSLRLVGVRLSGFTDTECGGLRSRAVVLNPSQTDLAVPVHATGIDWGTTPASARFDFSWLAASTGDDAHSFAAAFDDDGSLTGAKGAVVVGDNPTLLQTGDGCTLMANWTGYSCPPTQRLRSALLRSMDPDANTRRLGGLQITREVAGTPNSTWRTAVGEGPVIDTCADRGYLGYYPHLIAANATTDLYMPNTEPSHMRYNWYSSDPTEGAVVSYAIQRPYAWTMFVDGSEVNMMVVNTTGPQLPRPTDPAGTFLFNPQARAAAAASHLYHPLTCLFAGSAPVVHCAR